MSIQILRGKIPDDETKKIYLDDGDNTTGYRILSFDIAPTNWALDPDCYGRVSTEDITAPQNPVNWDWSDTREKAWAALTSNGSGAVGSYITKVVDDIIIEDLYISARTQTAQDMNYMLILEKIKIASYQSALARVQNSSQG